MHEIFKLDVKHHSIHQSIESMFAVYVILPLWGPLIRTKKKFVENLYIPHVQPTNALKYRFYRLRRLRVTFLLTSATLGIVRYSQLTDALKQGFRYLLA